MGRIVGYSDVEQSMNKAQAVGATLMPMDPLGRLKMKREQLTEALQRVDAAIAALEANPSVTDILRLLSEAGERF